MATRQPSFIEQEIQSMTMTDEEKAARAERRAQERLAAALEAEREYQKTLREDDFRPESWRSISYCNKQLLRAERSHEWDYLRDTRDIHLRQGALTHGID